MEQTKYETTITEVVVHRAGTNPIYGEGVVKVRIDDEAGGYFIVLTQDTDCDGYQKIRLDPDEAQYVIEQAMHLINLAERK